MHFVCVLYAFPYAYIFVPSALLLSQTLFLYALYAVFFGVVFSHNVHSRFFNAYNAYKFFRSSIQATKPTERTKMRTRPQKRAMTVRQEWSE